MRRFLVEAVLLGVVGGGIGVSRGLVGSHFIATSLAWPTRVLEKAIVLAFAFSAGVGLLFGYYGARRAARLDPIDALRSEQRHHSQPMSL